MSHKPVQHRGTRHSTASMLLPPRTAQNNVRASCLSHALDVLPCRRACAVPWDCQDLDVETVIREFRGIHVCQLCIDLVLLRRTSHETSFNSSGIKGTPVESCERAKCGIHSDRAMGLCEAEMSIEVIDVVALTAWYQGVLCVVLASDSEGSWRSISPFQLRARGQSLFLVDKSCQLEMGNKSRHLLP